MPPSVQPPQTETAAGLSSEEAARRLERFGLNELVHPGGPHWSRRFGRNLVHLFALLLWAGSALALLAGMPELTVAIVVVILVNAVFSFAQEYRAERAVEALRAILPHRTRVRRDQRVQEIAADRLVPGDLVILEAGDRISADGDLLSDVELRVDMSTLTGESRPVRPERAYAGTYVVTGAGEAIVTATGMKTELGRIATLTQRAELHDSPLEQEMRRVTRLVALLSVSIGVTFFFIAGALGMGLTERFVFALGVTVANVPEGLLPTVTLSLALATQRMARRNAIVRRLSSVETLGATDVICTDKTGTLTENQMTVRRVWLASGTEMAVTGVGYAPEGRVRRESGEPDPAGLAELARCGALCNDAELHRAERDWAVIGDPTEGALLTLAHKAGLDPEREAAAAPRSAELPFDSSRKLMTTVHAAPGGAVAFVKGAPSSLLPRTTLTEAARDAAREAADSMAREGLRVLALARRSPGKGAVTHELEQELELLGIVGMHDPPRPEVPDALARCRTAGIRVIMVTGDHGVTAEAIARRLGMLDGPATIIEGTALDTMDDDALVDALLTQGVLVSRVTPEHKLRIAAALQGTGRVVAMTGDGVNDAPALRTADIGVAMGQGGTDVAREAADIVLLDDNFASIAAAVEEGRAVYDNIRRFAQYHFSSNVAELMAFLVWGLSGGAIPLPLVVMQVLAIDLGTDLLPAIALGTERAEPGVMNRRPRPRSERLLNLRVMARVYGFVGLLVGVAGLASFIVGYALAGWTPGETLADSGSLYVQATAMTYAGIVAGQVGAAFAFRTNRESVFTIGLLSNRLLLGAIAFEIALLVCFVSVPPLQDVFHTEALDPLAWPFLLVWPVVVLGAEELRKAAQRRAAPP